MKTEFELDVLSRPIKAKATIIGRSPKNWPYAKIENTTHRCGHFSACIKDKDLERFAVNILKALKSKKLKQ